MQGQPFAIRGATAYGQYDNTAREIALAQPAHLNVIELVEFDTRYHDLSDTMSAATWTRVDRFVAAASAGIHVVLNLSEYGQSLAAAGYTRTTFDWANYLSFIANRVNTVTGTPYRDDPTIAMLELFGEIDAPNYGSRTAGTTSEMTDFFRRTLAEWNNLAPQILADTGGFSYLNELNSGIDWRTIVSDPHNAGARVSGDRRPWPRGCRSRRPDQASGQSRAAHPNRSGARTAKDSRRRCPLARGG